MKSPTKIGRNDPCPCGSGRKFKHCCIAVLRTPDWIKSAASESDLLPPERLLAQHVDVENRLRIFVSNDVLFNQIRRDCPRVAEGFDKLCEAELQALNDEVCRFMSAIAAATTSTRTSGRARTLHLTCFSLLLNSVQSFIAAVELVRRGFRLQPGILIRSVLENVSTVCHIVVDPRGLAALTEGTLSSTKTIASAKKVLPPFGQFYGFYSDQFVHVGRLHTRPNPISEYSAGDEGLEMNLGFLRSTIWIINVATELAFFDSLSGHRYFRKLSKDAYVYDPSDQERQWLERFLDGPGFGPKPAGTKI